MVQRARDRADRPQCVHHTAASWISAEARACAANPKLFALALREQVTPETILEAPIWQVVDGPALAILPEQQERFAAAMEDARPQVSHPLEAVFGEGVVEL